MGDVPSPGIVIAILALVAGVTGAAVASPVAKKPVTKKKVRRIADKEIDKLAPSLSVAHADVAGSAKIAETAIHADTANHASNATTASVADVAGSADPIAFARVTDTGNVIETRSKGVTDSNVELVGTAAYCFHGLSFGFAIKGAQVTVDYADASGPGATAQFALGDPNADCSSVSDAQAEVSTASGGSFAPEPFFVVFYS